MTGNKLNMLIFKEEMETRMAAIAAILGPDFNITLIARNTAIENADVLLSTEEHIDDAITAIGRITTGERTINF